MTTYLSPEDLRRQIGNPSAEVAILDARSPAARASGHLAVSTGAPLHELEQRVAVVVPVRTTPIVLAGEPEVDRRAADILTALGYTDVAVLEGGLDAWTTAGERIYTGTNVRSKTLGEWIELQFGTRTAEPAQVAAWRAAGEDVVVLDSRPHAEYIHHHIPGAYNTGGGAELAFRGLQPVDGPDAKIVVNCAGRTRGIVGAQSLVNTGIPNPVYSLHNGTPAWGWAGLDIESGDGDALNAPAEVSEALHTWARATLEAADATVLGGARLAQLCADDRRTTYLIDVRRPEEHAVGSVPGARQIQGGQLVQGTDEHLAVRRARVVLVDTEDLVRAASTIQWLRYLHDGPLFVTVYSPDVEYGAPPPKLALPEVATVGGADLATELSSSSPPLVVDLRSSQAYRARHLPGSRHARREQLPAVTEGASRVVLVGDDRNAPGSVAQDLHGHGATTYEPHFAARELLERGVDVRIVEGGPSAVPLALTDADPQFSGEIADQLGPPPFGPERDAWYREYFEWEYSLVPSSAGDPDFDFARYRP